MIRIGFEFIQGVAVGFEFITHEDMGIPIPGWIVVFDLVILRVLIERR